MGDREGFCPASAFIGEKIRLLLKRYGLSCRIEENRIEYVLADAITAEQVSFDLVLSRNRFAKQIHVCKFYPGLHRQDDTRYLSAACFFLLVHHFGQHYNLNRVYTIFLQTRHEVFTQFYATLKDFCFQIRGQATADNVNVWSTYVPCAIDTSMIREKDEFL